jgi:hypothetical protein
MTLNAKPPAEAWQAAPSADLAGRLIYTPNSPSARRLQVLRLQIKFGLPAALAGVVAEHVFDTVPLR